MFWEMVVANIRLLGDWIWLAVMVPAAFYLWLLVKRLSKKFLEAFVKEASVYVEISGQRTAKILFAILSRLFTFRFASRYRQHLIYIHRDYQIIGLKTRGPFVLDLEKVFVPLHFSPKSPQKIPADIINPAKTEECLSIWNFLAKSGQSNFQHIAVIGPPGSGKTTLLWHLALIYAKRTQRRHHRQAMCLLPILLLLRKHYEQICDQPDLKLSDLIQSLVAKHLQPPSDWFQTRLMKGDCLVMLDGLDEIADASQRQCVGQWVNQQMSDYPRARFILTSRPHGYLDNPLGNVHVVLAVQPFNLQEIEQFLDNWYLQNEIMRRLGRDEPAIRREAQKRAADLKKRIINHATLAAMAINPLLLTMIATLHDNSGALPERRVGLYNEICDVLLGRRREAKGLTSPLSVTQKRRVLQTLALALMKAKTRSCILADGSHYIHERLVRVAGPDSVPADFLRGVEELSGLLVQRETGVYEFAHKSFQEYLAAVEIREDNLGGYLLDKLTDPWWEETIRLYAVQAGDVSKLLEAVLTNPTVGNLSLAWNCLKEGAEVSPDIRQRLLSQVEATGLESHDATVARLAAQVKLSQRLAGLVRLDENRAIDPGYITCAEYQLFIDDRHQKGVNRQPDHWNGSRFASGLATQSVTGVRCSDAIDFCEWLTDYYPEPSVRYRLPTLQEVDSRPSVQVNNSCWCRQSGHISITGDTSVLNERYRRITLALHAGTPTDYLVCRLALTLDSALDRIFATKDVFDLGLARDLAHELTRDLDLTLARDLTRDHTSDLALARDLARDLALILNFPTKVRELACERARAHAPDRSFTRDLTQDLASIHDHNLDFAPMLDRDDPEFARITALIALDRAIVRDRILALANAVDLDHTDILERALALDLERAFHFALALEQALALPPDHDNTALTERKAGTLALYVFLAIVHERAKGNLPAWEGIRIVKEKIL